MSGKVRRTTVTLEVISYFPLEGGSLENLFYDISRGWLPTTVTYGTPEGLTKEECAEYATGFMRLRDENEEDP